MGYHSVELTAKIGQNSLLTIQKVQSSVHQFYLSCKARQSMAGQRTTFIETVNDQC